MTESVPIGAIEAVELVPSPRQGVCRVRVLNPEARNDLSWDRYVRLRAAANAVRKLVEPGTKLLDVGGYDGALGLFLNDYELDLIDPATTGASLLHEPAGDQSYDLVSAIDVLEHIVPAERTTALKELARVARRYVILNYPCQVTKEAQQLVLRLTNNSLVREHVQWELPDSDWVLAELAKYGFKGTITAYASIAVWLGQYVTLNLAPKAAKELNRYLVENYADEPFSDPLYHLIVCQR